MKFLSVDQIEENYVICEDENRKLHILNIKKLPKELKEGDVIKVDNGFVEIDESETKARRRKMISLKNQLIKSKISSIS